MIDLEYKMTTVDLNMTGYRDDPFVLAKDVIQVFYVMDMSTKPKRKLQTNDVPSETVPKRHIVLPGKQKIMELRTSTMKKTTTNFKMQLLFQYMLTQVPC